MRSDTQANPCAENAVIVTGGDVSAVRATLMQDLAEVSVFAQAIGKHARTVHRMIVAGTLPTVNIGRTPYVVISRAREALINSAVTRHRPVGRGRPINKTA